MRIRLQIAALLLAALPGISADLETRKKIAVMVHIGARSSGSPLLRGQDLEAIYTMLHRIVAQPSARVISVVGFNLEQQKLFFEQDVSGSVDFGGLNHSLGKLKLGTISSSQLAMKRSATVGFLGQLIQNEMDKDPDAVVVLGTQTDINTRVHDNELSDYKGDRPIFYVRFIETFGYFEWGDVIENLVRKKKGTAYDLHELKDFEHTWSKIEAKLESTPPVLPAKSDILSNPDKIR